MPQDNSVENGEMETSNGRYVTHIESTANQEDADAIADDNCIVIYRVGAAAVAKLTQQHDITNDGVAC